MRMLCNGGEDKEEADRDGADDRRRRAMLVMRRRYSQSLAALPLGTCSVERRVPSCRLTPFLNYINKISLIFRNKLFYPLSLYKCSRYDSSNHMTNIQ